MIQPGGRRRAESVATALYVIWGAIGLSIVLEFGALLYLQRQGAVTISDAGEGPLSPAAHTAVAGGLFIAAAALVLALRSWVRNPERLAKGARDRRRGRGDDASGQAGPAVTVDAAADVAGGAAGSARDGRDGSAADATVTRDGSAADATVTRFAGLSVAAWAVAEALALAGFVLALALPPSPRIALTICFTGGLFLWLLARPALGALGEALRRLGAAPP